MIHSIHTTFQQFHKWIHLAVAREAQWLIELTLMTVLVKEQDSDIHHQNSAPRKTVLYTVMGCSIANTEHHIVHIVVDDKES